MAGSWRRSARRPTSSRLAIAFKRIGSDQVLWSNDRYTFRETYPINATGEGYVDQEDEAIERAAERFAETMVSDLLEGF